MPSSAASSAGAGLSIFRRRGIRLELRHDGRVGCVAGVKYIIGEIRDVVGPAAALACRRGHVITK